MSGGFLSCSRHMLVGERLCLATNRALCPAKTNRVSSRSYSQRHLSQQVATPTRTSQAALVYLTGNQFKQALEPDIKAMQVKRSGRQKVVSILWLPGCSGQRALGSSNDLFQCQELSPQPLL
jgi:hypothetical protein